MVTYYVLLKKFHLTFVAWRILVDITLNLAAKYVWWSDNRKRANMQEQLLLIGIMKTVQDI